VSGATDPGWTLGLGIASFGVGRDPWMLRTRRSIITQAILTSLQGNALPASCYATRSREDSPVETFWDWFTVFCFAGLVTLMLQRSTEYPRDKLWQYAPPGVGLAVANYVGNEGIHWLAVLIVAGVGAYVMKVLKPEIFRS
jgi:hypothetical protein